MAAIANVGRSLSEESTCKDGSSGVGVVSSTACFSIVGDSAEVVYSAALSREPFREYRSPGAGAAYAAAHLSAEGDGGAAAPSSRDSAVGSENAFAQGMVGGIGGSSAEGSGCCPADWIRDVAAQRSQGWSLPSVGAHPAS